MEEFNFREWIKSHKPNHLFDWNNPNSVVRELRQHMDASLSFLDFKPVFNLALQTNNTGFTDPKTLKAWVDWANPLPSETEFIRAIVKAKADMANNTCYYNREYWLWVWNINEFSQIFIKNLSSECIQSATLNTIAGCIVKEDKGLGRGKFCLQNAPLR